MTGSPEAPSRDAQVPPGATPAPRGLPQPGRHPQDQPRVEQRDADGLRVRGVEAVLGAAPCAVEAVQPERGLVGGEVLEDEAAADITQLLELEETPRGLSVFLAGPCFMEDGREITIQVPRPKSDTVVNIGS